MAINLLLAATSNAWIPSSPSILLKPPRVSGKTATTIALAVILTLPPTASMALDMDAFASASLTPPPPSKMSEDAAMCRYGQASKVKKLAVTSFTQRCLLFSDNSSLFATIRHYSLSFSAATWGGVRPGRNQEEGHRGRQGGSRELREVQGKLGDEGRKMGVSVDLRLRRSKINTKNSHHLN